MITRNFNLYLNAGHSVPLVINVNQYDSGEQWVFTLYNADGTKYTPSTGAIVGIKSDGLGIINSGSVVDGNVVINETQQMTAAVGKAVFELMIDNQTHGTANFVVLVEEKPGNNADLSESDLSLLEEAINATSPLPTGGTVGQVLTKTANGSTWSDAGTPTQEQVADAVSDWADEHITVTTGVVIDTSLSVAGAAADAKKTGDEITDLKSTIENTELETVNGFSVLSNTQFVNGTITSNGFTTNNAKRIRTNAGIFLPKGSKLVINPNGQNVEYDYFNRVANTGDLNTDYARTYSSSWLSTNTELTIANDTYVFFIIKKSDDTVILPSDLLAEITVYATLAYRISQELEHFSDKSILKSAKYWQTGYKIGSTGYKSASEDWQITQFFPVSQGEVVHYELNGINTSTWFVAFYTAPTFSASNFVAENSVASVIGSSIGAYIAPASGYIVFVSSSGSESNIVFDDYVPDYAHDYDSDIPAYWAGVLSNKISTVRANRLAIGKDISEFIFVTDTHWKVNAQISPAIIKKLSEELEISTVLFGGDVITGTHPTKNSALTEVYAFYSAFNGTKMITTLGNHDLNNNSGSSAEFSLSEAYVLYTKRMESFCETDKDTTCAVCDFENQNVRVIEIMHPTSSFSNSAVTSYLDSKIEELTGWTVVVLCHAYWNSMPAGSELTVNVASINLAKHIADKLDASGNNGFLLCGHTHRDATTEVVSESSNTLRIIGTTTDAYSYGTSDGGPSMEKGTATEQAIDIVQIDTANKVVYMTRVGAGDSRILSY